MPFTPRPLLLPVLCLALCMGLAACSTSRHPDVFFEPETHTVSLRPGSDNALSLPARDRILVEMIRPLPARVALAEPRYDPAVIKFIGYRKPTAQRLALEQDATVALYSFEAIAPGGTVIEFSDAAGAPVARLRVTVSE